MIAASLLWVVVNAASITPVVTFAPPDFPESIAIDKGNTYVSMFATGEIRQIAPDGTQSTLAVLGSGPTTPFPGRRLTGLAVDAPGNVYAALNDVAGTRGVWQISRTGTNRPASGGLSFSAGDPQVEQGRASSLFVHLVELAGRTAAGFHQARVRFHHGFAARTHRGVCGTTGRDV
jgi:hypothetical protein